jgi:hypothetical protein
MGDKMYNLKYLFVSLFFLAACVTSHSNPEYDPLPQDDLAAGVVGLKETATGLLDIYDRSGTIWKRVDLEQDSIVDTTLKPHSIKLDYNNLVFRCLREDTTYYAVIADENSGLVKYVKKDDPHFAFQTWEQHLLHVFSVGFDEKGNALRASPDAGSATLPFNKEENYHPVEIRGDWMKVQGGGNKRSGGWVKWKEGHKLILDVYYTS